MNDIFEYSQADHIDFSGKNFVLTGFGKVDEDRITAEIRERGGAVKSSLIKATDYLIVQEDYDHQTVKYTKARQLQEDGRPVVILPSSRYEELKNGASGSTPQAEAKTRPQPEAKAVAKPKTKAKPKAAPKKAAEAEALAKPVSGTASGRKKAAEPKPEYDLTPWAELLPKPSPDDTAQPEEQDAPASTACLDSFVRLDVFNPAVRDILLGLGLPIEFFAGLCGAADKPFGSCACGGDSLHDLHFRKSLALTLAEITERLLLLADCGADNTACLAGRINVIRQLPALLREHREEIDSFGFVTAHLEKGFAGGPDGAAYEEYIYGREGCSLIATADNKTVFNCVSCAEREWFVTPEVFEKKFRDHIGEFRANGIYANAREQYYDELLMGQHPEFFGQYDTPANRFLQFMMALPEESGEPDGGDMIDGRSLHLLRLWAQQCGRQQTYKR